MDTSLVTRFLSLNPLGCVRSTRRLTKDLPIPSDSAHLYRHGISKLARWIVLGNLLVAVMLILGTWWSLQGLREEELGRAQEVADNLTHNLSIELASQFNLVDNALSTIAMRYADTTDPTERSRQLKRSILDQSVLLGLLPVLWTPT